MRGCRHSGVRVIVPPRKAPMPMRITCRYLKRDKLSHPPPLMEGEALASRVLELGPVGAKFLGPVIIEVPHFASLRGKEREIVICRSDNGETWKEHTLEASHEAVQDVLNESFEGEELGQIEDLQTNRITRILTEDFPQYFAIITRLRQEVHPIGPEGGTVSSSVVPQVQAVFPPNALTKKIRVGLQAQPIPPELTAKLLGNRVAISPIVTVEPRRRKFHKPITLTIPIPQAASKGMINQYSGEAPTLRLLCSISGGSTRAQWEDVTGSTPLTFVKDCVSFTTTVSARFWLMDCRNIGEATKMATELYREAIHVPFMAKFVIFAKRIDVLEARLCVFCMTDDKEDKTLEHQEHFTEVAKSRDVEVLEGKSNYVEFGGNLIPITKSGDQLQFTFKAFKENRLPFNVRIRDQHEEPLGRIFFMKDPKIAKGDPSQAPICVLQMTLPENILPDIRSEPDLLSIDRFRKGNLNSDVIHRADIRLSDISNRLHRDWILLAKELDISPSNVKEIEEECPNNIPQQAMLMLRLWLHVNGDKPSGNMLSCKKILWISVNCSNLCICNFSTNQICFRGSEKWKKLIDCSWLKKDKHRKKLVQKVTRNTCEDTCDPTRNLCDPLPTEKESPPPPTAIKTKVPHPDPHPCPPLNEDDHPVLKPPPKIPVTYTICPPEPDCRGREMVIPKEDPLPYGPAIDIPNGTKLRELGFCPDILHPKNLQDVIRPREVIEVEKKRRNVLIDEKEECKIGIDNGMPGDYMKERVAIIYKYPKNVMQSGTYNTTTWRVKFNVREKWENPTMGWTSSSDSLSTLEIHFDTLEGAIEFCRKNEYDYQFFLNKAKKVGQVLRRYLCVCVLSSSAFTFPTGNVLSQALKAINREDIVNACIFNVEPVKDATEKEIAKIQLDHSDSLKLDNSILDGYKFDQSGFESLKNELMSSSRDGSGGGGGGSLGRKKKGENGSKKSPSKKMEDKIDKDNVEREKKITTAGNGKKNGDGDDDDDVMQGVLNQRLKESTNAANVLVKQFDSLTYEYINENYLNEFIQDLYESCMNEDDDDDEKNKTTTAAAAAGGAGATGNKKKSNGSRIVNDSDIIESKKINVKIFENSYYQGSVESGEPIKDISDHLEITHNNYEKNEGGGSGGRGGGGGSGGGGSENKNEYFKNRETVNFDLEISDKLTSTSSTNEEKNQSLKFSDVGKIESDKKKNSREIEGGVVGVVGGVSGRGGEEEEEEEEINYPIVEILDPTKKITKSKSKKSSKNKTSAAAKDVKDEIEVEWDFEERSPEKKINDVKKNGFKTKIGIVEEFIEKEGGKESRGERGPNDTNEKSNSKRKDDVAESDSDSDSRDDSGGRVKRQQSNSPGKRTIASSSGSDVALHEGAELSPDDNTDIGGPDGLRQSMQNILDQFMNEEKRYE
ncbi:ankyrin 2,3/unc44, putative [Pediculus humanus corporis]|uniref:NADH dehydrogenase [ubiquinone] iron-sulfur protein 4, mitochondrial n=1 Tax=Pediculus humanus subsp. corporis TaxID=121224 RepID=E0W186_PEDHC|nr:ankyrin 2,3/unc44, putative [Pediculus humanus corporis]EEB19392.1 ankyrin 2,3/unc44, putative [Pediculus humanus corporis]